MGSRRLGRQRLMSLEKRGTPLQKSQFGMGAGMSDTFVRANKYRDGSLVVVEMVLDLGTADAAIASFAGNDVIGVDGASGTIFTWDYAVHGYIIDLEMLVLENPTTGDDDLHIYHHTAEINANAAGHSGTTDTTVDITAAVKGKSHSAAIGTGDLSGGAKYFYIVSDGSTTGTYATGKVLIRTTGFVLDESAADTFV